MKSYREQLLSTAASMAIHLLASQAAAKTEEERQGFGSTAYSLLDYALLPDSARDAFPITPEIAELLNEVSNMRTDGPAVA